MASIDHRWWSVQVDWEFDVSSTQKHFGDHAATSFFRYRSTSCWAPPRIAVPRCIAVSETSRAMSWVTSRDRPLTVLKLVMRAMWPDSPLRMLAIEGLLVGCRLIGLTVRPAQLAEVVQSDMDCKVEVVGAMARDEQWHHAAPQTQDTHNSAVNAGPGDSFVRWPTSGGGRVQNCLQY